MNIYKVFIGVLLFFCSYSFLLYYLAMELHNDDIHFPRDIDDMKLVSKAMHQSQKENPKLILLLFCAAYVYKQTFAIPGSFLTNILGGALYGTWHGFPLVCILSASGATCCYLLSKHFAREILVMLFPDRISRMQQVLNENESTLFYFLLSARLFPGSPNWIMNVTAPIIGVPIIPFFFSVLLGLMPYNFICVHTGSMLSSLTSSSEIFSYSTLFGMLLIAVVAALPGVIMQRRKLHQT